MTGVRSAEGANYNLTVLALLGLILILGRYGVVNLDQPLHKAETGKQDIIFWMSGSEIEPGFYATAGRGQEPGVLTRKSALVSVFESFLPEDGHAYHILPDNEPRPEDFPDAAALLFFQPININTAQLSQLMTINGVGEQLAERIIDYRLQKGRIDSRKSLENVQGIGPQKAALISRFVRFQ